jgi:hypothetical protein
MMVKSKTVLDFIYTFITLFQAFEEDYAPPGKY